MPNRSMAILIALLVLVVAPLAARAEEAPVKLGLTPVDVDGSYFDLELEPGQSEVLTVELANFGEEAVEVKSYAAGAYSLINGGFGVRLIGAPKTGSTHWLNYDLDDFTLEPEDPIHHTFTVEVPEDAEPGDYLTSVVVQTAEPVAVGEGDSNVGFQQTLRQAVAVAINVPGPRKPALQIPGDVTQMSNESRSIIRIGVENPGNQHLAPLAEVVIEDANGTVVHEQEIEMSSVYAGTETAVELTLRPALEPGDYVANLELLDEETGTTASAEDLAFIVEAPPEPEEPEEETGVSGIINDPRMPGDGGTDSLLWLLGLLALVAGLATLVGVLIGRRRSGGPQSVEATASTKPEPILGVNRAAQSAMPEAQQTKPQQQSRPGSRASRIKPLLQSDESD